MKHSIILLVFAFTLLLGAGSTLADFSQFLLLPNGTGLDTSYHRASIGVLNWSWAYDDDYAGVLQDWYGSLWYNGVENVTMPASVARWTFDADNATTVIDRSVSQHRLDLNMTGMYSVNNTPIDDYTAADSAGTFFNAANCADGDSQTYCYSEEVGQYNGSIYETQQAASTIITTLFDDNGGGGCQHWVNCLNSTGGLTRLQSTTIDSTGDFRTVNWVVNNTCKHLPDNQVNISVYMTTRIGMTPCTGRIYNINLTYVNAVNGSECMKGNCYYFDGSTGKMEYTHSATDTELDFIDSLSVFAWVRPEQLDHAGGGGYPRIISKTRYQLYSTDTGRPCYQLSGLTPAEECVDTVGTLSANTSAHVGYVYNGSTVQFYLNGSAYEDPISVTGTLSLGDYLLTIGERGSGNRYWRGLIDDVYLINESLSAEQVAFLFHDTISTQNVNNGSWYANISWYNYTETIQDDTTPTAYVYDTILTVQSYDALLSQMLNFSAGLEGAKKYNQTTTDGSAMFNVSMGDYSFMINATATTATRHGSVVVNSFFQTLNVTVPKVLNITILDEYTGGVFNMSSAETIKFSVHCQNSSYDYFFQTENDGNNSMIATVDCPIQYAKIDLTYEDSSYFRTLIPESSINNLIFYAVNALEQSVVQINLLLNDLTGSFIGGIMGVSHGINGAEADIVQQYWDVENKVVLFLLKNQGYTLRVVSPDGEIRNIGELFADVASEKTVTIPFIEFYPGATYGDTISYAWDIGNDVRLWYNDTTYNTTTLEFTVFNGSNTSQELYSTIEYDVGYVQFTYALPPNTSVLACFNASSAIEGVFRGCNVYLANMTMGDWEGISDEERMEWTVWFSLVFILLVGGGVAFYSLTGGLAIMTFFTYVFVHWDWLVVGNELLMYSLVTIMGVATVISAFVEVRAR